MNEWATRFISERVGSLVGEKNREKDFSKFLQKVNDENDEHMSLQHEFDEEAEMRPSYDQLSYDRIVDEANKNISIMRLLENIIQDRVQAHGAFNASLSKSTLVSENFQSLGGTQ